MQVIKNEQLVDDQWVHVSDDGELGDGQVIVSLERWQANKNELVARGNVAVQLNGDHDVTAIVDDLEHLPMIALEFPAFADGRCYSHARLLRERYGYKGEIRAVGNVLRDQLFYMRRVGFDAFELDPSHDAQEALAGFKDFSVTYQPAAN